MVEQLWNDCNGDNATPPNIRQTDSGVSGSTESAESEQSKKLLVDHTKKDNHLQSSSDVAVNKGTDPTLQEGAPNAKRRTTVSDEAATGSNKRIKTEMIHVAIRGKLVNLNA
jgi:hypothetical protein